MANVMIMSSEIRRLPYADMLVMAHSNPGVFDQHIETLLSATTNALGFASLRQLFETYAPSVTLRFVQSNRDLSRIPPRVLGYANRRESASVILRLGLPVVLLLDEGAPGSEQSWHQFRTLASVEGVSLPEALKVMFPLRVALRICSEFDCDEGLSKEKQSSLWRTVLSLDSF